MLSVWSLKFCLVAKQPKKSFQKDNDKLSYMGKQHAV